MEGKYYFPFGWRRRWIGKITEKMFYIVSFHHVTSTVQRIGQEINDAFSSLKNGNKSNDIKGKVRSD